MKTITPKAAIKFFVFLLILFSAKAFSHPRLNLNASNGESRSKMGYVKKINNKVKPVVASATASKVNAIQSKKILLKKRV